jgi:hypothetical protein
MTSFLKRARQFINIENNQCEIEINYDKYIDGFGYEKFKDKFVTSLISSSNTYYMTDGNEKSLRYEQFLDTMVIKTTETLRRSVLVQLDNVMCLNRNIYSLIRIMNTVKIIDPTFIPPIINVTCSWQKRMVREFCLTTLPTIVNTTTNEYKLQRLFRVLQLIEEEMR